jgi:hypothetical protein
VNEPKGISAIRLSHLLETSYKTAFVLGHKLREVVTAHQSTLKLGGEVEIDAMHCGGYMKPAKDKPSKRNRRKLFRNKEKEKVIMVIRERFGRSRCSLVPHESMMSEVLGPVLERDAMVFSDSFSGSARIAARYQAFRVNHSKGYADGMISTNHAESFFSRLRRKELGTHHKIAGPYTLEYANTACWLEDNRGLGNGERYNQMLTLTGGHPVSRTWKGYWQRRKEAA